MNLQNKWPELQQEEIEAISLSRLARQIPVPDHSQKELKEKFHDARLAGIAFSGGGIRSATFNLGILQGLANLKLVNIFDYLSTVSGGGYIGSWLSAWIFRSLEAPQAPEFTQEEFDEYNLEQLCADIEKDLNQLDLEKGPHTLKWLNNLLEKKELYDHIHSKNKEFKFSDDLQQLCKIINPTARGVKWPVQPIKCLNRLVLEELYQDRVPACRQRVIDKPREALNRIVGALNTSGKKPVCNPSDDAQASNSKSWESEQVSFLRRYSNYLTPRRGFTTDTLTLGVAYTINFVLNLVILVLILSAVLTLPIIVVKFYQWIASQGSATPYIMISVAAALLVPALYGAFAATKSSTAEKDKVNNVIGFVFFFLLTCISMSMALWQTPALLLARPWYIWSFCTASLFGPTLLIGRCLTGSIRELKKVNREKRWQHCRPLLWEFLAALIAGLVTGPLLYAAAAFLQKWRIGCATGHWQVAVWGLPIALLIFGAATIVYTGIAGRSHDEYLREWIFRLWALLAKYACAIAALLIVVVYGPLLLTKAETYINEYISTYLTIGWLVSTIGGVLAGKSEWLQGKNSKATVKLIVTVAPYLFIAGLLLFLSWGLQTFWTALPVWLKISSIETMQMVNGATAQVVYWGELNRILDYWFIPLAGYIVFSMSALVLSWRVGVNDFSLHALYGNRLVRAYLGASNPDSTGDPDTSKRDPVTFFNPSDNNVRLNFLSSFQDRFVIYPGPFPIINTTLNLMKSQNLAWQKRKGASFIFSALYSGYDRNLSVDDASKGSKSIREPAYVRSNKYSSASGVSLGKAMTISGAAASPNMGYYTSTPLAFLMTVFNVRLGWWLANPIKTNPELLKSSGPKIGFSYLLKELLAKAGEKSRYVYLSDGGHFENLGIYELVKRRCRYIVACDAAQDREMKFNDLGNAIEKCRTDFGVDILIDVDRIRRQNEIGHSAWHCAVGNILYSNVDRNAPDGTLIYIKASLTGDEPLDLARYASQYPDFPHQSTADQWFDETQFESYRRLGEHIARTVFGRAVKNTDVRAADAEDKAEYAQMPATNIEGLFHELQEHWYPPSEAVLQTFARHASGLERIISQLKSDEKLRFLDLQMYPAFSKFGQELPVVKNDFRYLPESAEELRTGFYMCKQMLIFMESVYHDLNLDREFDHPDNRGWVNLFQRWAWSRMFRFTWSVTASTFGARFQKFCEQRMNFRRDGIQIGLMENGLAAGCEVKPDIIEKYSSQAAARDGSTDSQRPKVAEDAGILETDSIDFWKSAEKKFGFNYFERRIIEDLLRTSLKPSKIFPIFIKTDDNPLKDDAHFYFNVGFLMMDLDQARIYYFRIQNHLRRMGLARRSLRALLNSKSFQENDISIDFIKPSPTAPEITSSDDRIYFEQLLHSVKSEIQK